MGIIEEKIQESYEKYGWTPEQREVFNGFVRERMANYKKPQKTIEIYLNMLNKIVVNIKKPFSEIEIEDLFPILESWKEYSSATTHSWRAKLRAFLRWESGDKHDPRAEKIRTTAYVSPVTLDDLLTEEEIIKMREVCKDKPRNLAMLDFHLLWGPRPSESTKLRLKDVKITDRYIVVNIPQTKTISRPVPIPLVKASVIKNPQFLDAALNSYVSMIAWLNAHPGYPDHLDYPLWPSNYDPKKALTIYSMRSVFQRMGLAAEVSKPVSTYTLRRTAFNRFRGVNREMLCAGFGWKPGSKMPTEIYNKLRPQDYLETLVTEGEQKKSFSNVCPECKQENPKDHTFCAWCGAPLIELPASATLKQFHADQRANEELTELREKMATIENILGKLLEVNGFDKLLEEAAKQP